MTLRDIMLFALYFLLVVTALGAVVAVMTVAATSVGPAVFLLALAISGVVLAAAIGYAIPCFADWLEGRS